MREIKSEEELYEMINSGSITVIDFYKDGCQPCERLSERLAEASIKHAEIIKVNCGDVPELAAEYEIEFTPTLVVLINGAESGRGKGYLASTKLLEHWNDK